MSGISNWFRSDAMPVEYEMLDLSDQACEERLNKSIQDAAKNLVPTQVKSIFTRSYPHLPSFRQYVCTISQSEVTLRLTKKPREDEFYFNLNALYVDYSQTENFDHSYTEIINDISLHKPENESDDAEIIERVKALAESHLPAHSRFWTSYKSH